MAEVADILKYIARDNPIATNKVSLAIEDTVAMIRGQPQLARVVYHGQVRHFRSANIHSHFLLGQVGRNRDPQREAHAAAAAMRGEVGEAESDIIRRMENRLKDLMACIDDWLLAVQRDAVAALETNAGHVSFHEPSCND